MNKGLVCVILILLSIAAPLAVVKADDSRSDASLSGELAECVILLHGMGRTEASFQRMAESLRDEGYLVWNSPYRSSTDKVGVLAVRAIDSGLEYCATNEAANIHFVSHSLGGILIRQYLQDHEIVGLGKIVMIVPPNHGSEVADVLSNIFLYRWIMGPAALQLGTNEDGLIAQLEEISGVIGVIAGNKSWNFVFSSVIPGPDDGKVSVRSAGLNEMEDMIELPESHTFILRSDPVIQQSIYFLKHGRFKKE